MNRLQHIMAYLFREQQIMHIAQELMKNIWTRKVIQDLRKQFIIKYLET